MLEIRKTGMVLNEHEIAELEHIMTEPNEKEAFAFLKQFIYEKIVDSQKGK